MFDLYDKVRIKFKNFLETIVDIVIVGGIDSMLDCAETEIELA